MSALGASWAYLADTPLLWLGCTLSAYLLAMGLYRRGGKHPLLLPVFTAVSMIVAVLWLSNTPYPAYRRHTWLLQFLIGPATVALAIPLYDQLHRLKKMLVPLLVALLAGSVAAIVSAIGIAWMLGATLQTRISLAPKSATMPIAMDVADLAGGLPALTTVAVAITGVSGAIMAGAVFRLLGIRDPAIQGFSMGLSAHAIGVGRAFQWGETAIAFAALGMGLNGILTALLVPLVFALLALF